LITPVHRPSRDTDMGASVDHASLSGEYDSMIAVGPPLVLPPTTYMLPSGRAEEAREYFQLGKLRLVWFGLV
jgi:hypothetical protein